MHLSKYIFIFYITLFAPIIYGSSCGIINTTVPFQSIPLDPNCHLNATYSFGTNAIIFCYTNNMQQNIGNITWPYQGTQQSNSLPIFLKTNSIYEGEFADPQGQITILNTENTTIIVNCQFGF